jgi:hypothetical protein
MMSAVTSVAGLAVPPYSLESNLAYYSLRKSLSDAHNYLLNQLRQLQPQNRAAVRLMRHHTNHMHSEACRHKLSLAQHCKPLGGTSATADTKCTIHVALLQTQVQVAAWSESTQIAAIGFCLCSTIHTTAF